MAIADGSGDRCRDHQGSFTCGTGRPRPLYVRSGYKPSDSNAALDTIQRIRKGSIYGASLIVRTFGPWTPRDASVRRWFPRPN
jgi:hypothetical protein